MIGFLLILAGALIYAFCALLLFGTIYVGFGSTPARNQIPTLNCINADSREKGLSEIIFHNKKSTSV